MDSLIKAFEVAPLRKKILMILGLCGVLLLFMGASHLLSNLNSSSKTSRENAENSQASAGNTDGSQNVPQGEELWIVYRGEGYTISYPPYLKLSQGILDEDGTIASIEGIDNEIDYIIDVEETKYLIEDIYGFFRTNEFKEEEFVTQEITGKKFSAINGQMNESSIVFQSGGRTYKISLSYRSKMSDVQIEQIFSEILATFRLT